MRINNEKKSWRCILTRLMLHTQVRLFLKQDLNQPR